MSINQKEQKADGSSSTPTTAENLNISKQTSSELVHREPINNTPFEIVGNEESGYFIALGKYKLTENTPTIEEARKQLRRNMWNIILNIQTLFVDFAKIEIQNEILKSQKNP